MGKVGERGADPQGSQEPDVWGRGSDSGDRVGVNSAAGRKQRCGGSEGGLLGKVKQGQGGQSGQSR